MTARYWFSAVGEIDKEVIRRPYPGTPRPRGSVPPARPPGQVLRPWLGRHMPQLDTAQIGGKALDEVLASQPGLLVQKVDFVRPAQRFGQDDRAVLCATQA